MPPRCGGIRAVGIHAELPGAQRLRTAEEQRQKDDEPEEVPEEHRLDGRELREATCGASRSSSSGSTAATASATRYREVGGDGCARRGCMGRRAPSHTLRWNTAESAGAHDRLDHRSPPPFEAAPELIRCPPSAPSGAWSEGVGRGGSAKPDRPAHPVAGAARAEGATVGAARTRWGARSGQLTANYRSQPASGVAVSPTLVAFMIRHLRVRRLQRGYVRGTSAAGCAERFRRTVHWPRGPHASVALITLRSEQGQHSPALFRRAGNPWMHGCPNFRAKRMTALWLVRTVPST